MMVNYSGKNGRTHTYLCSRTHHTQTTRRPCQSIGGLRFDRTVTDAFLQAVTPAAVDATAAAVDQLEAEHAERRRLQLLAVERAEYEAERRRRQFDACEPENRLVARTSSTHMNRRCSMSTGSGSRSASWTGIAPRR